MRCHIARLAEPHLLRRTAHLLYYTALLHTPLSQCELHLPCRAATRSALLTTRSAESEFLLEAFRQAHSEIYDRAAGRPKALRRAIVQAQTVHRGAR